MVDPEFHSNYRSPNVYIFSLPVRQNTQIVLRELETYSKSKYTWK